MKKLKNVLTGIAIAVFTSGNTVFFLHVFGCELEWSLMLYTIPFFPLVCNPATLALLTLISIFCVASRPFGSLTIIFILVSNVNFFYFLFMFVENDGFADSSAWYSKLFDAIQNPKVFFLLIIITVLLPAGITRSEDLLAPIPIATAPTLAEQLRQSQITLYVVVGLILLVSIIAFMALLAKYAAARDTLQAQKDARNPKSIQQLSRRQKNDRLR